MTSPRRFESDLPALLADLYLAGTPDYRDDLVRQTARVRQRPAWTFPERWLPMELVTTRVPATRILWRQVGALALLAVLIAAALAAYVGSRQPRVPAPFGVAGNGVVAYSAAGDIYVADTATGAARAIIGGPERDIEPRFSRDGTQIVFQRMATQGGDIGVGYLYVARSDGTGLTLVTSEAITLTPSDFGDPYEFSPDGQSVVTTARGADSRRGILVAATDRNRMDWLDLGAVSDRVAEVRQATFRPPDGGEILFLGTDNISSNGGPGLFAFDRSSGSIRPIIEAGPTAELDMGSWSPDGSRISFATWDATAQGLTVRAHVVDADGSNDRELPLPRDAVIQFGNAWSNDGTRMLPVRGYTDTWDGSRPVIIPTDGSSPGVEVPYPGTIQANCCYSWTWSPDDTMIIGNPIDATGQALQQVIIDVEAGTIRPAPWESTDDPVWQRVAS